MRIAHVSLMSGPMPAYAIRLNQQAVIAAGLGLPIGFHWLGGPAALDPAAYPQLHVRHFPGPGRIRIRWQQCRAIRALLRDHDRVVLRYPFYDPVLQVGLPGPVRRRIITEHHTREAEELATMGDRRAAWERRLGGRWLRRVAGMVAVTPEILAYEMARSGFRGPAMTRPNGIDTSLYHPAGTPLAPDPGAPLELVFAASSFLPWHGLEALLAECAARGREAQGVRLHLAGRLTPEQRAQAAALPGVVIHGLLERERLAALYARCHAGLSSYRMARAGLTQGSNLKVREYLAMGLPVVAFAPDPAFPPGFPHLLTLERFDPAAIRPWVAGHRAISRRAVQGEAREHIDAGALLARLVAFCGAGGAATP